MKKRYAALTALVFLVPLVPSQAEAQVTFGPQVGLYDFDDLSLGARVNFGLGQAFGIEDGPFRDLFAAVSGNYVFIGDTGDFDVTFLDFSGNVAVPFAIDAAVTPYAGLGLNFARASVSFAGESASNTESGLNLLGGLKFGLGTIPAFVELQHSTTGPGITSVFFGVMFGG